MSELFNDDQARAVLEEGMTEAQQLIAEPAKVSDVLGSIEEKLKEVPVIGESIADVPLMISMIKSYVTGSYRAVSPKVIALMLSALLYLIRRKDLIPDSVPLAGYVDDIAIIALALKLSNAELREYEAWRNGGGEQRGLFGKDSVKPAADPVTGGAGKDDVIPPKEQVVFAGAGKDLIGGKAPAQDRVEAFLKEAGVFFLATADGDQPKLRPLGAHFLMDGKVLFGVGDFKNVYKQLKANPKTEIAACKSDGHWLRFTGKAVFETDPKYAEAALNAMPNLKSIYNEKTGHKMMMFHLEGATAVDIAMMGDGEDLLA